MYFSKALAGNEEDGLTEYVCCSLERSVHDEEECVIIGTINFSVKEYYFLLFIYFFNSICNLSNLLRICNTVKGIDNTRRLLLHCC